MALKMLEWFHVYPLSYYLIALTAILTRAQVQAVAGALSREVPSVVSVLAARVANTGVDPLPLMKESLEMTSALPKAELLWASVREVLNIFQAADCGRHIVTVPHDILAKATKLGGTDLAELSLDTVRLFHADAMAAASSSEPDNSANTQQKACTKTQ